MTHTAAMTSLMAWGGFFMLLTTVMSAGLRVLRAATASVCVERLELGEDVE